MSLRVSELLDIASEQDATISHGGVRQHLLFDTATVLLLVAGRLERCVGTQEGFDSAANMEEARTALRRASTSLSRLRNDAAAMGNGVLIVRIVDACHDIMIAGRVLQRPELLDVPLNFTR
ncbi:MAG: hypothetical protein NVSMB22_14360 [Chloroflexota bacterium]